MEEADKVKAPLSASVYIVMGFCADSEKSTLPNLTRPVKYTVQMVIPRMYYNYVQLI